MTTSRTHRLAAIAAATAAILAAPATALAHPSVWTATAKINPTTPTSDYASLTSQTRYVVSNHGYAAVLRETNGKTTMGVLNYQAAPGNWRSQVTKADLFANTNATSGAQVHATCDVASLTATSAILAWQDADPFYAYIPFQKTSAGFEDDPAKWIPVVQAKTGVDLSAIAFDPFEKDAAKKWAGFKSACEGIGGTFFAPDDFNSPPTETDPLIPFKALSSMTINEQVEAATDPLNDKIAEQDSDITGLKAKVAELEAAKAASDKALAEAQASAKALADKAAAAEAASSAASAQLKAASIPLGLAVSAESFSVAQLKAGISVKLTGPAGERAHARLLVSTATRRELRLPLRTLASATTTLGADGTTTVTLKSSAKALAKLTAATKVTVDVSAGGRTISTTATLTT